MNPREITRFRLQNQQITAHPSTTPQEVVAALGAMQGQDYRNALWAIGLRLPTSSEADIERAVARAEIVRTWAMRGTLHFVAAADVRWILELLAPRIIAARAYRRRALELDGATLTRSGLLLGQALSERRLLTRSEAMGLLERAGIETAGQRGIHILSHLSLEGLLCQAAFVGREPTFALLDTWVPEAATMEREAALGELGRRYFRGHGPATLQDFVWWSGLTVAEARTALETAMPRLTRAQVGDAVYWMGTSAPPAPSGPQDVHVLPGFDEYVLGYRDREVVMDAAYAQRVVPGGNGVFRPAIVVNGRVVGTWRLGNKVRAASVVELFSSLDAATSDAIAQTLRDYDGFARGASAFA